MTAVAPIRTAQTLAEISNDLREELGLLNKNPGARGLNSGIRSFDAVARDSFVPGAVITVAGGSGGGKTGLIWQLALAFSSQCWTHIVTLEDEALDAAKRMLANVTRENVAEIRRGFAGRDIPEQIEEGLKALAERPIQVDERPGIDIWELIRIIGKRSGEEEGKAGVVFIDQLSHISVPRKDHPVQKWAEKKGWTQPPAPGTAEYLKLEWIVELLQAAARFFNVTIVLAHQLNNVGGADKEPTLENIRGSQGIVHKSEAVYVFWVPANIVRPNPAPGPGEPKEERIPNLLGTGFILGLKQRKGVKGFRLPVTFVGENQVFLDNEGLQKPFSLPPARSATAQAGAVKLNAFYAGITAKRLAREKAELESRPTSGPRAEIEAAPVDDDQVDHWSEQ